jgi:L-arabinose isomerase
MCIEFRQKMLKMLKILFLHTTSLYKIFIYTLQMLKSGFMTYNQRVDITGIFYSPIKDNFMNRPVFTKCPKMRRFSFLDHI